jgi:hypothetical protein
MSSSDRLSELQRQRTLVQQQLAWLDREIQAVQTGEHSPSPALPAAVPVQRLASPQPVIPDADSEAIIDRYRTDEKSLTKDVRKGCILYAFGAFVLLVLGVVGLYLLLRH